MIKVIILKYITSRILLRILPSIDFNEIKAENIYFSLMSLYTIGVTDFLRVVNFND